MNLKAYNYRYGFEVYIHFSVIGVLHNLYFFWPNKLLASNIKELETYNMLRYHCYLYLNAFLSHGNSRDYDFQEEIEAQRT